MSEGLNAAERFIFRLCRSSFLRLWSYANPQGKDPGKELCDVLVVCPPDVIVFSIKDVALKHGVKPEVSRSRWRKKAVEDSAKQIYGAERHIRAATYVIRSDNSSGLAFPKLPELRVHRVAVAAGSRGEVPIPFGDFGKGFIHVFDEIGAQTLLSELDTVTDFISYLIAKENFCSQVSHMIQAREEDLLAIFLQGGRRFPDEGLDVLVVADNLWDAFMKRPEVTAKQESDKVSYVWDRLIDAIARDFLSNHLEPGASLTNVEQALRVMAREDRFSRRVLGEAFKEFLEKSTVHAHATLLQALSGVVYVFLASPRNASREHRKQELLMRCFVARGLHRESKTVVGVATEQYSPEGWSMDIAFHHQPEWRDEHQRMFKEIQSDLRYFVTPSCGKLSYDEYPVTEGQSEDTNDH